MDNSNSEVFDHLNGIFDNIHALQKTVPQLHDILMFYFSKGLELFETQVKGEKFDVSEQILFISDQLGFNLTDLVLNADKQTVGNISGANPDKAETNEEITNFIMNSSKIIDNLDDTDIANYKQYIKDAIKDIGETLNK